MYLKAYKDYFLYLFSIKKLETIVIVADLVIFILSILAIEEEWKNIEHNKNTIYIIILAILILIKFILETYSIRFSLNSYFKIKNAVEKEKDIPLKKIAISEKEQKLNYEKVLIRTNREEGIIYSKTINKFLQSNDLNAILENKLTKKIRNNIKENFDDLIQFFNYYFFSSLQNKRFFNNGKKLCLSKDIEINEKKNVYLHKGYYFDSMLTNQLFGKYLENIDNGRTVADAREFDPIDYEDDGSQTLRDITTSNMNNHIGSSTIAFTNDNYFIIWKQNSKAQVSRDMLAPTGSGSANVSDYNKNFNKIVINNMERELAEECSLNKKELKDKIKTKVLGFYRWINRGGLPQFAGISKIDMSFIEFEPNKDEVLVNYANISENKEYVSDIDDLPRAIESIRKKGTLSVPLYMNLLFLEQYYSENKEELKNFFFPVDK